jgi:glycine/D-amino acid oxidase-like deaminating enzyme
LTNDAIEVPPDTGRGWWILDALAAEPGEPAPPLSGEVSADVVILGGGYTGLWTALHLKELDPGIDVVLLEQDICGGGPSGRNGGFVSSWWSSLPTLCKEFGDEAALRLCRAGEDSVDAIGRFCADNGVDAWFRNDGDLTAAASDAQMGEWADLIIAADRLGIGEDFQVLAADEIRARIDSPTFQGGVYTKFGATVQPARLARGLRGVLLDKGVKIFEDTPVKRFGAGSPVIAETPGGSVKAGSGVVAINAWASHWKRFRRLITVRGSYIVLTEPAPEALAAINWTDGVGVADFRAAVHYVRNTPDGRMAFGIGGMQPNLARKIGPRFAYDEEAIRVAIEDMWRMFPTFRSVPVAAAWGGPIDVAGLHVPFFGTYGESNIHYGLGYTGNGVGPAHMGGRILALKVLGRDDPILGLPVVDMEPARFPPEPIRSPGAYIANEAIRRKDEAEDRGETPGRVTDFVARLPRRMGYHLGP